MSRRDFTKLLPPFFSRRRRRLTVSRHICSDPSERSDGAGAASDTELGAQHVEGRGGAQMVDNPSHD